MLLLSGEPGVGKTALLDAAASEAAASGLRVLRAGGATTQARQQLGAALDIFRRLDARPWQARAENELRAAGLVPETREARGTAAGIVPLTSQEYEVAMLAAAGLTNKQIGERLFLSHRTVAAHLYQAFPKLGVTSRAALRDALLPPPDPEPHSAS